MIFKRQFILLLICCLGLASPVYAITAIDPDAMAEFLPTAPAGWLVYDPDDYGPVRQLVKTNALTQSTTYITLVREDLPLAYSPAIDAIISAMTYREDLADDIQLLLDQEPVWDETTGCQLDIKQQNIKDFPAHLSTIKCDDGTIMHILDMELKKASGVFMSLMVGPYFEDAVLYDIVNSMDLKGLAALSN